MAKFTFDDELVIKIYSGERGQVISIDKQIACQEPEVRKGILMDILFTVNDFMGPYASVPKL